MALDKDTVKRIAFLARVDVPDPELDALAGELTGILDWIEQLAEVDTDGVEPMSSVAKMTQPLREDAVTEGDIRDKVLANAPQEAMGFYLVPKVVE